MASVRSVIASILVAGGLLCAAGSAAQGPVRIAPGSGMPTSVIDPSQLRANPDKPLLVGTAGGYGVRMPGMTASDPVMIGSGFMKDGTTEAPIYAETPAGQLITLLPRGYPMIALPGGSLVRVSTNVPESIDMVVWKGALYGLALSGAVYRHSFTDDTTETFGSSGPSSCQFQAPSSIAVDDLGRIYIGDARRIVRIDDISGTGWATFGKAGGGRGQFQMISDIAVDRQSRIYAVDMLAHRLVRIDNMLGEGWRELSYDQPTCLAVDRVGRAYVCEPRRYQFSRIDDMDGTGKIMLDVRAAGWTFGAISTATITSEKRPDSPIR